MVARAAAIRRALAVLALGAGTARAQPAAEPAAPAAPPEVPAAPAEAPVPPTPPVAGTEPPAEAPPPAARPAEEVLVDPELQGPGVTPPPPHGNETIADPELSSAPSGSAAPSLDPGRTRFILHSRGAVDLSWDDPREEVFEFTNVAVLEAEVRRSESLTLAVGLRALHWTGILQGEVSDADRTRTVLDLVPTEGYADVAASEAVHTRLGWQSLLLGRFDVFNATNVLASYDLRQGVTSLPEGNEVAQLAVRADLDPSPAWSLRAVYVPFFTPHVLSLTESDHALFGARQTQVEAGIDALTGDPRLAARTRVWLHDHVPRSGRNRIVETGLAALGPEPDLRAPQGALRATTHGTAGELAATVATALEHVPFVELNPAFAAYLANPSLANPPPLTPDLVSVDYPRFFLASVDGATDAGPMQLGAELAYFHDRTLPATRLGTAYQPKKTGMGQVGLRAEYLLLPKLLVTVEGFGLAALRSAGSGFRWLGLEREGWAAGGALFFAQKVESLGLTLELGAGGMTGPSVVVAPRVVQELAEGVEAEVGATIIDGAHGANPTPGGVFDALDQGFVGVRVVP